MASTFGGVRPDAEARSGRSVSSRPLGGKPSAARTYRSPAVMARSRRIVAASGSGPRSAVTVSAEPAVMWPRRSARGMSPSRSRPARKPAAKASPAPTASTTSVHTARTVHEPSSEKAVAPRPPSWGGRRARRGPRPSGTAPGRPDRTAGRRPCCSGCRGSAPGQGSSVWRRRLADWPPARSGRAGSAGRAGRRRSPRGRRCGAPPRCRPRGTGRAGRRRHPRRGRAGTRPVCIGVYWWRAAPWHDGAARTSGAGPLVGSCSAQLRANSSRSALKISANLGTIASPCGAPG